MNQPEKTAQQRFEQRNAILDRMQKGEISPSEAEAIAASAGLPPFAKVPPPDSFDPMKRARWSLPMALAWVATRDIETVRTFDDDYRAECWYPISRNVRLLSADGNPENDEIRRGWEFIQGRPASWSSTCIQLNAPQAEDELLQFLESGADLADAVLEEAGKTVAISSREWSRLEPCDDNRGRIYLRYRHDTLSRVYSNVLLSRVDILKAWPAPIVRASISARKRCLERFTSMMALSPDVQNVEKSEAIAAARKDDPKLSERMAKEVWKEVAQNYPLWRRKGPHGPHKVHLSNPRGSRAKTGR